MNEVEIKLPKQWKHWCKKAGLRIHGRKYSLRTDLWMYLKGHGRVWRLNCHSMFQCGDTYAEFDRWALCNIEEAPCPMTEAVFLATVKDLLYKQRQKVK